MTRGGPERPRLARRLGVRLLAFVLGLNLSVSAASSLLHLRVYHARERAVVERSRDTVARAFVQSLTEDLWLAEETAVELQLREICTLPFVADARVELADGRVLGWGRPGTTGPVVHQEFPLRRLYKGAPVDVGVLRVATSLEDVRSELRRETLARIVEGTAWAFLTSLLILGFLYAAVTRPLEALAAYARGVGAANVAVPLALGRRRRPGREDEIDAVVVAVDEMRRNLARDLEARRRAEQELRASEERYRTVVTHSLEGIFLCEVATGRIVEANAALERMLGYGAGDLEALTVYDLVAHDPDEVCENVRRVALEGSAEIGERWYRRRDGSRVPVAVTATRVDVEARPMICAVVHDFTAARQAEAELRRLFEQAERDAETKAALLAEVNHRVKNNLIAILGLVLAERRAAPLEGRPWVEEAAERLNRRIRGLLSAHQLLSETEWAPTRVAELARRVITGALAGRGERAGVTLEVAPSDVRVSPRQAGSLALVLNELASNTVKHGVEPGRATRVGVRVWEEEGFRVVEYRDDGPGYPPRVLAGERPSVGLQLAEDLAQGTLRGSLTVANDGGAVTVVRTRIEEPHRT